MHKKIPLIWDRIVLQSTILWNKNCIVLQMKNTNLLWKKIFLNSAPKCKKKNGKKSTNGKNCINESKDSPTFSLFTQAKKRDEILQLLKKQREERISVRLILGIWINLSGWGVVNYRKFSKIDPLNLDNKVLSLLYTRGGQGIDIR